jgi:hypothetical protein
MDVLNKKLNALEIRVNALRLEILALSNEFSGMDDAGISETDEAYLALKLKFLEKKFELAQARSEKKILEMTIHSGHQAA